MKYLITILTILFPYFLFSQTVNEQFVGYGNVASVSSLGGGLYTVSITGFVGSPRFEPNGTWAASDVAVNDVVFIDGARHVITIVNSAGASTMNIRVSNVDEGLGVSALTNGAIVAVGREFVNGLYPMPRQGDGVGTGVPPALASSIEIHNLKILANRGSDYVTTDSFTTFFGYNNQSFTFSQIPIGAIVDRTTTGSRFQKTSSTAFTKRSTDNGLNAITIANTSNDTIRFNSNLNNRVQMTTGNVSNAWVLDPLYYNLQAVGEIFVIGVQAGTSAVTINWSSLYGMYTGTAFTGMPTTIVPAQSVMTFAFRVITTSAEVVKFQYVDGISIPSGASLTSEIRDTVTQTSHGFTIPTQGFIPVRYNGTSWVAANTTSTITVHQAFIVAIPSVNTFILQQVGAIQKASHGLTVGTPYYLQDNGTIAATPDADGDVAGDNIDPVCIATSSDRIMLVDRGSTITETVSSDTLFRSNEKLIAVYQGNTADADTVNIYQPVVSISGTATPTVNQSNGETFQVDGTGQTNMTLAYTNLQNNKPLKIRIINSSGLVTIPSTTVYYTEMGDLCIINPVDANNFTLTGYSDGAFFYLDNISAAVNCLDFSSTYDSILAYATSQGFALPSIAVQVKQSALIDALKAANIWYKFDVFYYLKNDGSRDFARINWRDPYGDDNMTEIGTVTWTAANGFNSNGLQDVNASCLNTNFNPITEGVKWTQNSMSMGVTVTSPGATNSRFNMGIGNLRIEERTGSGWQYLANNISDQTQSGTGTATRIIVRTASNATQAYTNATQTGTGTSTSAAPSSANMYVMAFNLTPPFGATATTTKYNGMVFIGAALNSTEVTNLINAYNASL